MLSGRGKLKPPTRQDGEATVDPETSKEGSTHRDDDDNKGVPDGASPVSPIFDETLEADILYTCSCEMITTAAVCAGTLR